MQTDKFHSSLPGKPKRGKLLYIKTKTAWRGRTDFICCCFLSCCFEFCTFHTISSANFFLKGLKSFYGKSLQLIPFVSSSLSESGRSENNDVHRLHGRDLPGRQSHRPVELQGSAGRLQGLRGQVKKKNISSWRGKQPLLLLLTALHRKPHSWGTWPPVMSQGARTFPTKHQWFCRRV